MSTTRKDAYTMTTTTRPRQLDRAAFVVRIRELLDDGLTCGELIEKLNPVRSMSVSAEYMLAAIESIAEALAVAKSVSNPKMTQAHRDFINRERRAAAESGVYAARCAHIETAYPDEPIRRAKRAELVLTKNKWRDMADQASADWVEIQKRRISYDQAVQQFPEAFSNEERQPWESNNKAS
jgi:hypothetical protein